MGNKLTPEIRHDHCRTLTPEIKPKNWQDLVNFVNQKIEGMERLLADKDERVDKLESKVASQERSILQKDVIIDSLVRRVSDLEMSVKSTSFSEKQQTRHHTTSNVDDSVQSRSTVNDTVTVHKTREPSISVNKHQGVQSKRMPYSQSNVEAISDTKPRVTETSSSQSDEPHQQNGNNHCLCQAGGNKEAETFVEFSRSRQNRVPLMQPVAFHATLSDGRSFKTDSAINFDHETIDNGSGYSPDDGIYIVPESGTYVLTWTMLGRAHQEFNTLLVVNGAVKGAAFSDTSENGDFYQSTSIVVLTLTEGDHVLIRMGYTAQPVGTIESTDHRYGVSTFSGWKLG
ncbi:uncharacterized protein LOC117338667 [Pecten maximus]|uniref:uncharacterized protein LOC117338667 n=1 Tax=Pecten maximus TaxID=6579 RepID=UPI0014586BA3|nr:uncharacterized protein LOC117338667 [Pecten maximus]